MHRKRLISIPLIAAFLIPGALGFLSCSREAKETEAVSEQIKWYTAYEEAMDRARDKNLPVMIDFYTDWCSWCKTLDNTTYSDATVGNKAKQFVSLKIDADGQRALAARYKVGAFPTILFIGPDGVEIHRVVGFRPPEDFLKEMDIALNAFGR
jgi:thiol:disulfide interchange protein